MTGSLLEDIQWLHCIRRNEIMDNYRRSLPLGDEFTDRWERASFLGFGEHTSIYDSTLVFGDVKVGSNTWIGPGCILDGSGGLKIGSYCSVAAGCHIYSHSAVDWAISGGKAPYRRIPARIGDCCFLASHSVIDVGVTIGSHCLVGANSMVNIDVPDYTFVAGTPAIVLGMIKVDTGTGVIQICPK